MSYIYAMFPDNRIRELRKAKGLTQSQLGELVGLHKTQIGNIENGSRNLTFEWARRIAKALEVPMADILGEQDNPYRMSRDEQQLLDDYRSADDAQREMVHRVAAPIRPFRAHNDAA